MKTRSKVMILVMGLLAAVLIAFLCLDGTFLPKRYASVWDEQSLEGLGDDQSRILALALRAASSHNMQPWLVEPTGDDSFMLYADMSKALKEVDAQNQQLLMSQGTFLERYKQAAESYGYGVEIEYHTLDLDEALPLVAMVSMHKDADKKRVDAISSCTHGGPFSGGSVDLPGVLDGIIAEFPGFSYTIIETLPDVERLKSLLLEGTIAESKDEAATKELLDVFRWTEWEKNTHRYGLSLSELPSSAKPFIQPIMKVFSRNWQAFGDSGIAQYEKRLAEQSRYILLKHNSPENKHYVQSGQIYQKLLSAVPAYDFRPAMQVLETYDAMEQVHTRFHAEYCLDAEVLMIIGIQEKKVGNASSNPRHVLEDIMVHGEEGK